MKKYFQATMIMLGLLTVALFLPWLFINHSTWFGILVGFLVFAVCVQTIKEDL